MPIILLVISTLVFWVLYWFVRMGGVDHVREHFQQRKDAARRTKARESERTAPLSAIDDPREAAIVLMLLPFAIFFVLIKLLPPWQQHSEASGD